MPLRVMKSSGASIIEKRPTTPIKMSAPLPTTKQVETCNNNNGYRSFDSDEEIILPKKPQDKKSSD